ncbi:zinc finger MYM-type protein 1-like [Parasteatoda tepidariorum]|uniref:zinc finger MYM-type protein 1-like n=1 Tax=Parasteatoda tepidariorum TaxID=114398 RepID=UPI001C7257E5|nr:zinc finger MYM-type protein 1-like [Parasteatoda tepidariorum]
MQGAFWKVCVLLGKKEGGRGSQELGAFVSKPFINWKSALEAFDHHANAKYHKFAIEQAANFVKVAEGKVVDVAESVNVENSKIAQENRKRLKAIVETILLCGRQELALRGSCDSGEIGKNDPAHNDGNFRALLRARSGDEVLKKHLLTQSIHSRAMYTSSQIQNEIIELSGKTIQDKLLERVKKAGYFSVLADETQDISRREQIALCVRYVDCSSGKAVIREDFVEFISVEDVSAQALATTIITHLVSYNLDMYKFIGQGYDGAAEMSGRLRGVRTIIAEQYPKAQFVHCVAHVLNLVLVHSCEVPMIRNCLGTIKSVINFFRQSPLRDGQLKKIADENNFEHSTLIGLCETRWTEKHVAVERFAEMLPVARATLETLQSTGLSDVATQAFQLQTAVDNSQFIVSLVILRKVFSYLIKVMQKVNVDLIATWSYAKTVSTTIGSIRNETQFSILFEEAKRMSSNEIVVPRMAARASQRNNVPGETAEIYYRRNVFYPFIYRVVTELGAKD